MTEMTNEFGRAARFRAVVMRYRVSLALLKQGCLGLLLGALLFTAVGPARAESAPPHTAVDRSGEIPTSNGLSLHLIADSGSVRIQTLPPSAPPVVRYSVHIETDAKEPMAQALLERYALTGHASPTGVTLSGTLPTVRQVPARNVQFWVQFVVTVPARFDVDVTTGAGDIETSDLGGRVVLTTQGGNIRTGRVGLLAGQIPATDGPAAKLETQGGHITLQDVAGDVDAYTAGGHIQAGNISGGAKLRTGGGHIRVGQIKGRAQLETDGGNITVGEAGSLVGVRTGGGQIDFGEVRGSVHAQTAGGGIRVMYVSGPMEVETSGGNICLTRVVNTIRAETGKGTITAWITPDAHDPARAVRLPGPSQLASSTGDIIVFLPRNIAATIDATVENGGITRIEADPAIVLSMQGGPEGAAHALGELNGGGARLKLRTNTGKIRLQYVDAETALRQSLLEEQKQRLAQRLGEMGFDQFSWRALPPDPPAAAGPSAEGKVGWYEAVKKRWEIMVLGGVQEDTEEFRKHVVSAPSPDYPQVARRAGLQGIVRLQVRMKTDGSLVVEKVLEGEPSLVEAAITAVRQWRAKPTEFEGRKVETISVVTFNFQLH